MTPAEIPGVFTGRYSQNSDPRDANVNLFVVHHAADPRPAEVQLDRFMNPNERDVSCTWFMDSDGTAYQVVPPDRRQWTTGYTIDRRAVTVETRNTSGEPDWGISQASMDGIASLVVWASRTFGFPIDRDHVMGHSEARSRFDTSIPATACPGPSMNLDYIVAKAREIAGGGGSTDISNQEDDDMIRIQSPNRGIALIGPGYYRPLANDEEVNASGAIISKHLSGNDRQFDLWVSMAVAGQGAGINELRDTLLQEARPLKLYTNKGKTIVEGPGGKSWDVPPGYRELLFALGLVGPRITRDIPDNERGFLDMILGLLGPASAPKPEGK